MTTRIDEQKANFRRLLDESRAETEVVLMGADPEQVIYAESGWRVKDIIAHLTTWEREVITSIRAYHDGVAYTIPGFTTDDIYNEQVFQQYRDVAFQQLQLDWAATRAGLIAAIRALTDEQWDGEIMCPWKLTSRIEGIVRDMMNHEAEHRHAIRSKVD